MTLFWWTVAYICFGIFSLWLCFQLESKEEIEKELQKAEANGLSREIILPISKLTVVLFWPVVLTVTVYEWINRS